jgi:2-oxoisovalerate dehydrogenase E1 component
LRDALVPDVMEADEWKALTTDVETSVMAACQKALAQAKPEIGEVSKYIFADPDEPQSVGGLVAEQLKLPATVEHSVARGGRLNMVEAIRQTLDNELAINPRCLIIGEDVGEKGGVHTATMGLMTRHGRDRVVDTSLSEEGIIGRAVGMALAGLMPVPEIQFRKYADPATEQLNNCGTIRWRTANNFAAPMVVRIAGGFGRKVGDPWHSVTSEAVFAHAVGWHVVFPSNAEDAVGLLRTGLRGNDPVIFFEHRALLDAAWSRRPYPGDDFAIPFGKAKVLVEGEDLTIVTWGAMTERCEEAVKEVGGSIELIDLRTISPWDKTAVLSSVRKTSKCLIVHEDMGFAGFGGEIAATIAQEAFMALDGPIIRLAAPHVPIPFNTDLMAAVVPAKSLIREAIEDLLAF